MRRFHAQLRKAVFEPFIINLLEADLFLGERCGLNSRYAGRFACSKRNCIAIMFCFCTKEIAKDLKRKTRIWRVVQEFMHIQKVKQPFCFTDVH